MSKIKRSSVHFTALMKENNVNYCDSWQEIYDNSLSLPYNLLAILKRTIYLPYDHYDLIAAYYLIPSALAKVTPYLFLWGSSGSGKSTVTKIASFLHGVKLNSSGDSFVSIRNDLHLKKYGVTEVKLEHSEFETCYEKTEVNTCMVWEDIDPKLFKSEPNLYRLFKFGYDRTSDRIMISNEALGQNLEFHCFCPKVFSSIHPFHNDLDFKELHRRLLVIPTQRIEDLDPKRRKELGIDETDWEENLIDIYTINWHGFSQLYQGFWDIDMARIYLETKKIVTKELKGLKSYQKTTCVDLVTTGIVCNIWQDTTEASEKLKNYFSWVEIAQSEQSDNLFSLLKTFVSQEEQSARDAGIPISIYSNRLRNIVSSYVYQGWLLEKPSAKAIREAMLELGYRLNRGSWVK